MQPSFFSFIESFLVLIRNMQNEYEEASLTIPVKYIAWLTVSTQCTKQFPSIPRSRNKNIGTFRARQKMVYLPSDAKVARKYFWQ